MKITYQFKVFAAIGSIPWETSIFVNHVPLTTSPAPWQVWSYRANFDPDTSLVSLTLRETNMHDQTNRFLLEFPERLCSIFLKWPDKLFIHGVCCTSRLLVSWKFETSKNTSNYFLEEFELHVAGLAVYGSVLKRM